MKAMIVGLALILSVSSCKKKETYCYQCHEVNGYTGVTGTDTKYCGWTQEYANTYEQQNSRIIKLGNSTYYVRMICTIEH